jgi:hypothetical protein
VKILRLKEGYEMAGKILSMLLLVFLALGFTSLMARADITGSFSANMEVEPIACGALGFVSFSGGPSGPATPVFCENTIPKLDFESSLNVNWTISGLTFGLNSVAGFTGIEQVLTIFKTSLADPSITDQFFFAVPFGTDAITFVGLGLVGHQTQSETAFTVISNNLLFVKKRVSFSLAIAGIVLSNLAEFGDFSFPMAQTLEPCAENWQDFAPLGTPDKCNVLPSQSSFTAYTAASQHFAFGDALSVSGQTVSGITVINTASLNLDTNRYESFKKISLRGVLCAGALETITVSGIPVAGGITADEQLSFTIAPGGFAAPGSLPACIGNAFQADTTLEIATPLGSVQALLRSGTPFSTFFRGVTLSFSSGALSLVQGLDGNLMPLDLTATLSATLNSDSNPARLKLTAILCQQAGKLDALTAVDCTTVLASSFKEIDLSLEIRRSGLDITVNASLTGAGTVSLSTLEFVIGRTTGSVNMSMDIGVLPRWIAVIGLGLNF